MEAAEVPETVERTITEADARLFRVRTVAAELNPGVRVEFLNPVEVMAGGKRIGWASLSIDDVWMTKKIVADLVFDYATPERLSIQAGQKLYARVEGINSLRVEPFEVVGLWRALLPEVQQIDVLGLEISNTPGYEDQPFIGEPVL